MSIKPPIQIQHAWRLYNCAETLVAYLWDTYQGDFLEHYFPEIKGDLPEPQLMAADFDDEDIPF